MFEETLNEKAALLINERLVDGGAPQIHACGNAHLEYLPRPKPARIAGSST
jgi:hypothetical protein